MKCKACKYCLHLIHRSPSRGARGGMHTDTTHEYECYRFPPEPMARSMYGSDGVSCVISHPGVKPDDYCGEYEKGEFFNISEQRARQALRDKWYLERYQDIERTEFEVERVMDTRIDCMPERRKAA